MITRADKSSSLVVLPIQQYESEIQNFLHKNNFHTVPTDPTNEFQVQIRKTVKQSKTLIPRDSKLKYINLNPSTPPTLSKD